MKKLIAIVLLLVFAFSIAIAEEEETYKASLAGWNFELQNWFWSSDNKSNKVIVLQFYAENVSAKWNIFEYDVEFKLFQDGIRLEEAFYVKDVDPKKLSKETRKGAKIDVAIPYVVENIYSDIEIEIYDGSIYFFEQDPIKWTIKVK